MKILLFLIFLLNSSNSQVKDAFEYGSKVSDFIALNLEKTTDREVSLKYLDTIFSYSLLLADSNIADALLFCAVGTMTYPTFKVKIPFLPFVIPFHVFSQTKKEIFEEKIKKIPHKLFDDSPDTEFGDKDKVVHFFSAAYLSYIFGERFANHIGYFVEEFEEIFKIDGWIDERDIKINELGVKFGKKLHYKIIYPSFILVKEKRLSYGKNSDN